MRNFRGWGDESTLPYSLYYVSQRGAKVWQGGSESPLSSALNALLDIIIYHNIIITPNSTDVSFPTEKYTAWVTFSYEIMKARLSFLTTSLGKTLVLPTFRLDALLLLKISFLPSEVVKKENVSSIIHVHRSK